MPDEFKFNAGTGTEITVAGWDGLMRWLQGERAKWAWLVPGDGRTDMFNLATNVQSQWNTLINGVSNVRDNGQPIEAARNPLAPLTNNGLLLASESPDGASALEIRDAAGEVSAAFAYGFMRGNISLSQVRNREDFLGALLTILPDLRDVAKVSGRLQQERTNYRNAVRSAIERIEAADRERATEFDSLKSRGTRIANRTLWRSRDNWRRVQNGWQTQANQAVGDIRATEATYLESMRLQAPVAYWTKKAEAHRAKEVSAVRRLLIFFPVAIIVLGLAFGRAGTYLLDHAAKPEATNPVALYVVITGGLAVVSTLLFWAGRLLTKLYLSEHHLRNDAEERAVMTETYLALTKEAAASDTDRDIILGAIFRSTPDGIVKDEGPGDFTLQAMLAKLMTGGR